MSPEQGLIWLLTGVLSLFGTGWYRRYALHRRLLDRPSARSSHTRPTPRGGGLAMAVAFCVGLGLFAATSGLDRMLIAVLGGGLPVVLVGVREDHRPLSLGTRLLVQFAAVVWVVAWLPGVPLGLSGPGPLDPLWRILELFALLWFINLYNFMDGLDGLAASEALFIALVAAALVVGSRELVEPFGLVAACALGFLYWNRPPARIFMGDAGSYFLGFTIGSLALLSVRSGALPLACWLILPGVFLVDATLTLLRRMLAGERWYDAHRNHAYQHAARCLDSHAGVMWGVALLNLAWLAPWAGWVAYRPDTAWWAVPTALGPLLLLALWLGAGRGESRRDDAPTGKLSPPWEDDAMATPGKYDRQLDRNPANYTPLSPLSLLRRSAYLYPDRTAVIHGAQRYSYREFHARCRRLASALGGLGVEQGDTVAVMAPNTPALLEAHFGVPMAGAVLNALNIRLDAATIRFILRHGEARVLLTDREFSPVIAEALVGLEHPPRVVDIDDPLAESGERLGETDYETLLAGGDPDFTYFLPADEWQAITLNYTSGTTGDPKGVVYHHRGAYLNALGNLLATRLDDRSVYLWTLPMFHCNGWTFTWAVTAAGATHVCLRRVDPALIFPAIAEHGVTHLCGAPIVLNLLIHAPDSVKRRFEHVVQVATGGAAPPSQVIARMEDMGFHVTHLYGLTESYGPSTLCVEQPDWAVLPLAERASLTARQGVYYPTLEDFRVADPETLEPVPADGRTIGELLLRGNTIMKGYLKNPDTTDRAFRGGWYHTGDLGVLHPDGYVEIKDRSKDIIISGGENISSLEVEEVLYKHPDVMEAAVVARPDEHWGETPCAFVTLRADAGEVAAEDIIDWCRQHLAHYKVPRSVVFGPLPKTSTGKIQKYLLREQARES